MEIARRVKNGITIWKSLDAEGRMKFAVTRDMGGTAVEPVECRHETDKSALRYFYDDERNDDLWGGNED